MDFSLPAELAQLKDTVDTFVRDQIIPFESDPRWTAHGPTDELRADLNAKAHDAGLLGIHSPKAYGGQGLSHFEKAVVFEAAGSRAALDQALDLVQKTGVLVQVGVHGEHDSVPFNPFRIYERELHIIGSNSLADKFPEAVDVMSEIADQARVLIDDRFEVWDFGAAVDEMAKGQTIKTQLRFGG